MANSRAIPGNEREVGGGEKQHSVLVGWVDPVHAEVDPALWQWGGHVT